MEKLKPYLVSIVLIILGLMLRNIQDETISPVNTVSWKGLGNIMIITGVVMAAYKILKK